MNDFYVYVIRCPDTNTPLYVGKGTGDRYTQHFKFCDVDYQKNCSNKMIKSHLRSLKRKGKAPVYELHHNLTEKEAFSLEVDLISRFGRRVDGTGSLMNIMNGGWGGRQPQEVIDQISRTLLSYKRGKPVTQYTLLGEVVRSYYSASEAARCLDISAGSITKCCKEQVVSTGGYMWSYQDAELSIKYKNRHKVIVVHLDGTEALYVSVADAARYNNIDPSSVRRVLSGKAESAKGLVFKYQDMSNPKLPPKQHKFMSIDLVSGACQYFRSKNEAARTLEVSHQAIGYAIKHKTTCKGQKITPCHSIE